MNKKSLKGKFLVASPYLQDENFIGGVVLLCEHDKDGAYGLILNKKAKCKAETHLNLIHSREQIRYMDLYVGGPVHTNHILILFKSNEKIPNENRITDNIVLVSNFTEVSQSIVFADDHREDIRLYLGCAGWSANQLETEIEQGVWSVLPSKEDMIFTNDPDQMWKQNLARLGGEYSILSNMPGLDNLADN